MTSPSPKPRKVSPSKKALDKSAESLEGQARLFGARAETRELYPSMEILGTLLKSMGRESPSAVGQEPGEQQKPFDFSAAVKFKAHNVHHSTCIRAKTRALVGLGHVLESDFEPEDPTEFDDNGMAKPKAKKKKRQPSKAALVLDPLCKFSWQHTMLQLAEDYWQTGNAFLEVVRTGGVITGLHWQPACDVYVYLENNNGTDLHFLVKGRLGGDVRMAQFGDAARFQSRGLNNASLRSEIIHLAAPTTMDLVYGVPQWLASGPLVELSQALHQHQFDFHVNRGVPEFLMLLMGAKADKKTWSSITQTFDSWVGIGNSHKASVFNIPDPNMTADVVKLAVEGIANGTYFRDMSETLATTIVSAHGVPPSLAGILIPGKMGASNESQNAMLIFQTLEMGPEQEHFETILGSRLGGDEAGLGLERGDFELRTLVEEMAEAMELMKPASTMGQMKQQLPEAVSEGRDLDKGVKKSTLLMAEALMKAAKGE